MYDHYGLPLLILYEVSTYTAAVYIISELGTRVLASRGEVKHKYKLTSRGSVHISMYLCDVSLYLCLTPPRLARTRVPNSEIMYMAAVYVDTSNCFMILEII